MNLEVLCWYAWHTSILSFLAMLEMGSGSDIAKDMHLQSFFWKRAYPQKHISASWCCFTTQSGCHRCNLSVSNNSGWTDTVRNSLSSFTFIDVFRLFVKAKGLKTLILEHAESLPDCLHPRLGAFGYCRWKSAFSLLLFETFLVNWSVYLLMYWLTHFSSQIKYNTSGDTSCQTCCHVLLLQWVDDELLHFRRQFFILSQFWLTPVPQKNTLLCGTGLVFSIMVLQMCGYFSMIYSGLRILLLWRSSDIAWPFPFLCF